MAHESPLAIGFGKDETFIASDSRAFAKYARDALFLSNREIAVITANGCEVYDCAKGKIEKNHEKIDHDSLESLKDIFAHYTLKEIHEQPDAIRLAMRDRFYEDGATASFEEIDFNKIDILAPKELSFWPVAPLGMLPTLLLI